MLKRITDKVLIDFHISDDYILASTTGDAGKTRQRAWMKNPPTYIKFLGLINYIDFYETPDRLVNDIIEMSKTTRLISWYKDIIVDFLDEEFIEETNMLFIEDLCKEKYKNDVRYDWGLDKHALMLLKETFELPLIERFEDDDKFFLLHGLANVSNLKLLVMQSMTNFFLWEDIRSHERRAPTHL